MGRAPTANGALVASHHAPRVPSSASSTCCSMVRSPTSRNRSRAARKSLVSPGAMALGRRPHRVEPSLYSIRYSGPSPAPSPAHMTSMAWTSAGRSRAPGRCAIAHSCSSGCSCCSRVLYSWASAVVSFAPILRPPTMRPPRPRYSPSSFSLRHPPLSARKCLRSVPPSLASRLPYVRPFLSQIGASAPSGSSGMR